ncbi:TPA: phage antirepressor KilAC domain-containing protein [Stenotrophomonas maltophilia]|nr:phage antirepressor KilAC domain-containing protein [Stenotrophomonas maltophilia]
MNELILSGTASINSREISELLGLRHDNVKRTIETLVEQGVIKSPQIEEISTATRPAVVFVFFGEQGKRDSIIVVAQLCPAFTARLVDRWQELEKAALVPRQLSQKEWALMVLESEEAREAAEGKAIELEGKIAEQAPKVAFHDQVVQSDRLLEMDKAAKLLDTGRNRLMLWMRQNHWLRRDNQPYQDKIDAGLLDLKYSKSWTHPERGQQRSVTPLVTGKGLARLQKIFSDVDGEIARLDAEADAFNAHAHTLRAYREERVP